MNIAEAKIQVKDTIEAYLAKDETGLYRIHPARQRPVFLVGAPGIGKTAIMEQIAQELGVGLVSYSMTHHTRQSALGLPLITHHEFRGHEYDASEYTMSEIIAAIYDYMQETGLEQGILFLDEINCVSETLYPSMLQFLQFKTFGRHKVPEGWVIVCAGNPPEYNKSVHEFDIVTLDRLRKMVVEPSFPAWKAYAKDAGVHPAILTFLDIKGDAFYSVETTPQGKSFVTARGWSDLSEVITLFEELGKPVDLNLVSQFVQDDEIANRFSLYYDLFTKYRSDYQVEAILAGQAPEDIVARAAGATFDERVALIGLLVDALERAMDRTLEQEKVLVAVRDLLRQAKGRMLDEEAPYAAPADILAGLVDELEADTERTRATGTKPLDEIRALRKAADLLKNMQRDLEAKGTLSGSAAFAQLSSDFAKQVALLKPAAANDEARLACAVAFLEEAFGADRETLVFLAELAARRIPAQFISRFGSETYFSRSEGLDLKKQEDELLTRIAELDM